MNPLKTSYAELKTITTDRALTIVLLTGVNARRIAPVKRQSSTNNIDRINNAISTMLIMIGMYLSVF